MESELNFMGLMVFKNLLKSDSAEVLTRLRKASFRVKMISGDNPLTCVSAGKQAAIVPEDSKFIILEQSND
jgi:cation-transporting ATPase 13A3/4/5